MFSTELIIQNIETPFRVSTLKERLRWDLFELGFEDWELTTSQITSGLLNSESIPFHEVIYLITSFADIFPTDLGLELHCWAQRFLTSLLYIHAEGTNYNDPPSDLDEYPIDIRNN